LLVTLSARAWKSASSLSSSLPSGPGDVPVLLWPEAQAVKASANVHGRIQRVCRFFMRLRFSIRLACCLGSSGASNINDRAVSREGDVRSQKTHPTLRLEVPPIKF
jgi:hypothetical protein